MEGKVFAVRLLKSPIGLQRKDKDTIRGMGFRRVGETKLLNDTPAIRGMIFKMSHMLKVTPLRSEKEYEKILQSMRSELPPIVEIIETGSEPGPKKEARKPEAKEAKRHPVREKKADAEKPKRTEKKTEKKEVRKTQVKKTKSRK